MSRKPRAARRRSGRGGAGGGEAGEGGHAREPGGALVAGERGPLYVPGPPIPVDFAAAPEASTARGLPAVPAIETVRDLRRAQILAAARALVAEGGLEGLTVGALERRLSFTRGVITYHFRDKDEIVEAVLDSAVAEIDAGTIAEVRARASFAEKIEAVLHSKVRGFLDHPEASEVLLSFWGRLKSDPRARRASARLFAGYRAQAALLLAEGRARGAFGEAPEAEVAALLVGAVIGIVVQSVFEPGAVDADASVREAARLFAARLSAR